MKVLFAGLIVAFVAVAASAQNQRAASAIRGQVTSAGTGRPLSGATVRLQMIGNPRIARTVKTDAAGRYEMRDLPAGQYSFSASHTGYLERSFDQPRPMARYRFLELADSEQLEGIDFALHRGGAVTGIIRDEFGDPMPGVRVEVMRETHGAFGRQLVPEMRMASPAVTDDQGRFRVYSLPPGTYVVAAFPETEAAAIDGSGMSHGRTYFPGTLEEKDARTIRVALARDAAVDFAMIPVRLSRVAGIVRDSQGRPASNARVILTTPRGVYFETLGSSAIDADGSFAFEHVRPGQHLLHVRPGGGEPRLLPRSAEWATSRVAVTGDDITDILLTTSVGFSVSGRVIFEGGQRPEITGVKIFASEVDRSLQRMAFPSTVPENGLVDAADRFRLAGVSGEVRLTLGSALPAGWFLKRVLLKGRDVTFQGFDVAADIDGVDVVLTDRATTVTGTVKDSRGLTVNQYMVAFFPIGQFAPADMARRLRTIRPDPDGVYRIRNLPPGNYAAVAVPLLSLPYGAEWDPAFFERIRTRTTALSLSDGEYAVFNLSLVESLAPIE